MKNHLILILCLLLAGNVFAQNKWAFGPVLSLGFSGENQHKVSEFPSRSGSFVSIEQSILQPAFGVGFSAERYMGKRWSINLGVEYSYLQSFDRTESIFYNTVGTLISYNKEDRKLIAQQIQVPLQAHFLFGNPGAIRPYISIGGLANYALSATQIVESIYPLGNGEVVHSTYRDKYDLGNGYSTLKRLNLSVFYGIGIEFKVFSIEFNRSQAALRESPFYLYYLIDYDSFINLDTSTPTEQTPLSRMLIRYKF